MGERQPLVVVVDYPGRRPEAHLSELPLERAGYGICDLLRHPMPPASRIDAYASALVAREPACAEAVAVLGYCAAAPLAARVASRLSKPTGNPLPVVFLDPSRCNEHHIVDAYATVVRQIEEGIDPEQRRPPIEIHDRLRDPAGLGRAFATDVHDRVRRALTASGFDEEECKTAKAPVAAVYLDWLNYLLAVHNRGEPCHTGPLLNLISAAHPADTAWLGVRVSDTLRLTCTRAELARRDETFDLVVDFLSATTTTIAKAVS